LTPLSTNWYKSIVANKTYTTSQVAKSVGISRQTLQVWISDGRIKAPKPVKLANMRVRLWSRADAEKARRFKGTLKRGPKSKQK